MFDADFDRLAEALFKGVLDEPPWRAFLNLLRTVTAADYVVLALDPPGPQWNEGLHLVSGPVASATVESEFARMPDPGAMTWRQAYAEGVPYALEDFAGTSRAPDDPVYRELAQTYAFSAVLHMHVREASGVAAWVTLTRSLGAFDPEVRALMQRLGSIMRAGLQVFVTRERERHAASLSADAVRRLQFGWITLGEEGQILDHDEQAAAVLQHSGALTKSRNGKLKATDPEANAAISNAVHAIAGDASSRPRAITVSRDPWLDMLMVPARRKAATKETKPAMIAYVHGDNWQAGDRHEQLAELFGLSPREARMALALSRGMTIAEAAEELNLTVGSARMYSKTIYAKTGARGLPDLVRIVMRSVLAFAPDE